MASQYLFKNSFQAFGSNRALRIEGRHDPGGVYVVYHVGEQGVYRFLV